jgi:hypothetical protein
MSPFRSLSTVLGLVTAGLGVALLVVTAVHGGGETGFLLGTLFIAAGAGRVFLLRRRS